MPKDELKSLSRPVQKTAVVNPLILAGGSGTRLWPVSREDFPKQHNRLNGANYTLFEETLLRFNGADYGAPTIVTGKKQRFLVQDSLAEVNLTANRLILEPLGRNTAPALALGALVMLANTAEEGDDPLILAAPADHKVLDLDSFDAAVKRAVPAAQSGAIVTFGITPDCPHTGYGYIEAADPTRHPGVLGIRRFIEKPNGAKAKALLDGGGCYWNSGIFLFSARTMLAELECHAPAVPAACRAALAEIPSEGPVVPDHSAFSACPNISIDYAVMEHTDHGVMVPVDCGWSDVGSWDAIWSVSPKDENGNAVSGEVLLLSSQGNYISTYGPLIAGVGLKDHVVVATPDAVFISPRDQAGAVKDLVAELKKTDTELHRVHREVKRPWGTFKQLALGDRYQVKEIMVRPGASLSLQMHYHRAEHWVVVEGTGRVECDDKVIVLSENQSTYIPLGATHRLHNPGRIPLRIVEIQTGSYLGEDDIVRLEDTYERGEES